MPFIVEHPSGTEVEFPDDADDVAIATAMRQLDAMYGGQQPAAPAQPAYGPPPVPKGPDPQQLADPSTLRVPRGPDYPAAVAPPGVGVPKGPDPRPGLWRDAPQQPQPGGWNVHGTEVNNNGVREQYLNAGQALPNHGEETLPDGTRVQYIEPQHDDMYYHPERVNEDGVRVRELKGVTDTLPGMVVRRGAQQLTLGASDDIAAGVASVVRGTPFKEELEQQQKVLDRDSEALGPTAGLAVDLGAGYGPGKKVADAAMHYAGPGSPAWKKLASIFATATPAAAVYDFNTQKGNWEDRSMGAAAARGTIGGTISAAIPAAPEVGKRVKNVIDDVATPHVFKFREWLAARRAGHDTSKINPAFAKATSERAADNIARGMKESGIEPGALAAGNAAQRMHGETHVAPALTNPTLGRMAHHAAAGTGSPSYGGQGSYVAGLKDGTLNDPVTGKSHADLVSENFLRSRGLPKNKDDVVHDMTLAAQREAEKLESYVSKRAQVPGIKNFIDNDEKFLKLWRETAAEGRLPDDLVQLKNGKWVLRTSRTDTVNMRLFQTVRGKASKMAQSDDPGEQIEGNYILRHLTGMARDADPKHNSRLMESSYEVLHGLHKRTDAIAAGKAAVGAADKSEHIAQFRVSPEAPNISTGVAYETERRIGAGLGEHASGKDAIGVADDLFGDPTKQRQMAELLPTNGQPSTALIEELEHNLRQIGARKGFIEKLTKAATDGKADNEGEALGMVAKAVRAFQFSSTIGGAAATVQYLAGPGATKLRQKMMLDILLDGTGAGERMIQAAWARDIARTRARGQSRVSTTVTREAAKNMVIHRIISHINSGEQ
jgi:hypothetical protein